ncbi:MAG TPA: glycoside hydrolase family 6 protein [Solirubrobacteraceae bacterium]|nr:glycoside hydrolase family 6 protein [Solirubrobacteraceae bacterium]
MNWRRRLALMVTLGGLAVLALAVMSTASGASPKARAAAAQCTSSDTSASNPANPLDTPGFTGTDPLAGANLFVESPWLYGGDAADAIANMVGLGWMTHQEGGTPMPWSQFEAKVNSMHLSKKVAYKVHMLEKIGEYPQAHQFSVYTAGGSGPAIFTQVQNYLCRMQRTTPGSVAEITTYFIKHGSGCTPSNNPNFDDEVNAVKDAVGNFPALIFVEEDAIDTICWRSPAVVSQREALLKYEIDTLSQIPHALLYVEGGTSDANNPRQVARVLNASDASKIRGFFLNDTHFNWAYKEIQFGNKVAKLTGGLHFVVDTRGDGNGPLKTKHPVTQGNEVLCNPPGRGLGPKPGASNGANYGMYSPYLDGFVWVTTPGESANSTCPGRPQHYAASGIFDPNIAIGYASRANDRIGPSPRFPSRPW